MRSTLAGDITTSLVRRAIGIFFLIGLLSAHVFAQPVLTQQEVEQRRIQYLIGAVADLKDARFLRNGTEYDAQQAAEHLRSKLRNAGDRIKTAEDFIVYCATQSSISGEKYRIKFAGGRMIDTATFLHEKLAAYPR